MELLVVWNGSMDRATQLAEQRLAPREYHPSRSPEGSKREQRIMSLFIDHVELTARQIAVKADISATMSNDLMASYQRRGLIEPSGRVTTGFRPARYYRLTNEEN